MPIKFPLLTKESGNFPYSIRWHELTPTNCLHLPLGYNCVKKVYWPKRVYFYLALP